MRAIETPIQKCFSTDEMDGSYYHEYYKDNRNPHTVHRYDKEGYYVLGSTQNIEDLSNEDIFYVSDRFGNKLEKGD